MVHAVKIDANSWTKAEEIDDGMMNILNELDIYGIEEVSIDPETNYYIIVGARRIYCLSPYLIDIFPRNILSINDVKPIIEWNVRLKL